MPTRQRHNQPGQVNGYVLDVDSDITSFGKHNRLLVFGTLDHKIIEIRENVRGLPMTTETDRQRVAKGYQRLHPRGSKLVYRSHVQWEHRGETIIDYTYDVVGAKKRSKA